MAAALPFLFCFYGNELKKTSETESTNCVVFLCPKSAFTLGVEAGGGRQEENGG